MKRWILALLVMLAASPGLAEPRVSGPQKSNFPLVTTVYFLIGDTTDSPAIPVSGYCTVRYQQSSGDDAALYAVTDPTTAASSGTLLTTFLASTSPVSPAYGFTASTKWVKAVATDATAGGSAMTIECAPIVGSGGGGGTSITGWPDLSLVGGTGHPTQAIVIDSLTFGSKLTGSGRDDDGDTWGGGCGVGSNEPTDQPCNPSYDSIAGLEVSIDGAAAAISNTIDIDTTDAQANVFCRDSVTGVHQIGTANDIGIAAAGDEFATVLRDATNEVYRLVASYTSTDNSVLNCTAATGTLTTGDYLTFPTATADKIMPFIMDGVHLSPYGSRWTAQEVLNAAWEDQYPEMLGTTNMITNGYMETTCTNGSPFTRSASATFAALAGGTTLVTANASVGQGCTIDPSANGETLTTATINAQPGGYYTGSIQFGQSAVAADATRSIVIKIQDNGGTSIANTRFWIGGAATGLQAELASSADASSVSTPGEIALLERVTYNNMTTIRFNFQVPTSATGFKIQIVDASQNYAFKVDELWVRPKVHADLERHPIIADGKAHIQLFTDSRGLVTRDESLQQSFDYMLGYTTSSGYSRTTGSIRPDLRLDERISLNTYTVSGQKLGWYVGENDGYETYSGTATTNPHFDTLIEDGTNYCMIYYGINDMTAGARSNYSANASPADTVANRHLYFGDQIRGFEMAAEAAGCIPIMIMEPVIRGDTTTTTCFDEDGAAQNCATWHQTLWKHILHNGIPAGVNATN